MNRKEIAVLIPGGVEAEKAAHLVQTANRFACKIHLEHGSVRVNAKSIMGMLSFKLAYQDTVTVEADGADWEDAMEAMEAFLTQSK